jgi:hypothetical protein
MGKSGVAGANRVDASQCSGEWIVVRTAGTPGNPPAASEFWNHGSGSYNVWRRKPTNFCHEAGADSS